MRILIIEHNTWDDTISVGNTLSNLFSDWPKTTLSYLYSRKSLPNNKTCFDYYSIPEIELITKYFKKERIGNKMQFPTSSTTNTEYIKYISNFEQKFVQLLKIFDPGVFRLFIQFLWLTKIWDNTKFNKYIKNYNPDIIFAPVTSSSRLYVLLKSILQKSPTTKVVLYFTDDVYQSHRSGFFHFINWKMNQYFYRKCVNLASMNFGITQELCFEYEKLFNTKFKVLKKGCEINTVIRYRFVKEPINFVYAGNLYCGRDEVLMSLGIVLDTINNETKHHRVHLDIYSNSVSSKKFKRFLAKSHSISLHEIQPYSKIIEIFSTSDLVLHVEAFNKRSINATRLSFSTKITDCMQSGSCLFAIGPKEVASISYIDNIPGAYLVTELNKLKSTIEEILSNPSKLIRNAQKLHEFAEQNHEILNVRCSLQCDFQQLLQG